MPVSTPLFNGWRRPWLHPAAINCYTDLTQPDSQV